MYYGCEGIIPCATHDEPGYATPYVRVMHYALQYRRNTRGAELEIYASVRRQLLRILPLGTGFFRNVIRYVMRHVMQYRMRYLIVGASIAFVIALLKPAVRPR